MDIKITDKVGLDESTVLKLVVSLLNNRAPEEGSFDYGLETHTIVNSTSTQYAEYPIHVVQRNLRKSDKSPIHITIEQHRQQHRPLF